MVFPSAVPGTAPRRTRFPTAGFFRPRPGRGAARPRGPYRTAPGGPPPTPPSSSSPFRCPATRRPGTSSICPGFALLATGGLAAAARPGRALAVPPRPSCWAASFSRPTASPAPTPPIRESLRLRPQFARRPEIPSVRRAWPGRRAPGGRSGDRRGVFAAAVVFSRAGPCRLLDRGARRLRRRLVVASAGLADTVRARLHGAYTRSSSGCGRGSSASFSPAGHEPTYSLVVPLLNEAGTLAAMARALGPGARVAPYEIILVDDAAPTHAGEIDKPPRAGRPAAKCSLRHQAGSGRGALRRTVGGAGASTSRWTVTGRTIPAIFPGAPRAVEAGPRRPGVRLARRPEDPAWRRARLAAWPTPSAGRCSTTGCMTPAASSGSSGVRCAPLRPVEFMQSVSTGSGRGGGLSRGRATGSASCADSKGGSKYGVAQLWWRPAVAMLRLRSELRRSRP